MHLKGVNSSPSFMLISFNTSAERLSHQQGTATKKWKVYRALTVRVALYWLSSSDEPEAICCLLYREAVWTLAMIIEPFLTHESDWTDFYSPHTTTTRKHRALIMVGGAFQGQAHPPTAWWHPLIFLLVVPLWRARCPSGPTWLAGGSIGGLYWTKAQGLFLTIR